MCAVTLYSFKGGVGRTQALANVGYELARLGHRVLAVDFDLEAPGLETFLVPTDKHDTRGIVDYICDYTNSGKAPPVTDYIQEVELDGDQRNGGRLLLMPSGLRDASYARRLGDLDWQDLYQRRDGYLFF